MCLPNISEPESEPVIGDGVNDDNMQTLLIFF